MVRQRGSKRERDLGRVKENTREMEKKGKKRRKKEYVVKRVVILKTIVIMITTIIILAKALKDFMKQMKK